MVAAWVTPCWKDSNRWAERQETCPQDEYKSYKYKQWLTYFVMQTIVNIKVWCTLWAEVTVFLDNCQLIFLVSNSGDIITYMKKTIKWMESIAQYVKRKSWCSEIIFLTNKSS